MRWSEVGLSATAPGPAWWTWRSQPAAPVAARGEGPAAYDRGGGQYLGTLGRLLIVRAPASSVLWTLVEKSKEPEMGEGPSGICCPVILCQFSQ